MESFRWETRKISLTRFRVGGGLANCVVESLGVLLFISAPSISRPTGVATGSLEEGAVDMGMAILAGRDLMVYADVSVRGARV